MTVMQSCDWHDQDRCVPDHLSRKTVSAQLRAAATLASAVEALTAGGMTIDTQIPIYHAATGEVSHGMASVHLGRFLALMSAVRDWEKVAPRYEESYEGPSGPAAEIRVPPDEPST